MLSSKAPLCRGQRSINHACQSRCRTLPPLRAAARQQLEVDVVVIGAGTWLEHTHLVEVICRPRLVTPPGPVVLYHQLPSEVSLKVGSGLRHAKLSKIEATAACLIHIIWGIIVLPPSTCPRVSDCIPCHGLLTRLSSYLFEILPRRALARCVWPQARPRFLSSHAYVPTFLERLAWSRDLRSPHSRRCTQRPIHVCCSPAEFSGIIGLMTAQSLLRENLSVALVERKQLGAGATGAGELPDFTPKHPPSMRSLQDESGSVHSFAVRGCVKAPV